MGGTSEMRQYRWLRVEVPGYWQSSRQGEERVSSDNTVSYTDDITDQRSIAPEALTVRTFRGHVRKFEVSSQIRTDRIA